MNQPETPRSCAWAVVNEKMIRYHDEEWGVPVHDDRKLYEHLVLDAFQAGLSWATVLNKRDNFRKAFDDFNPEKVARYEEPKIQALKQDARIIRNDLKIRAAVQNAQRFLEICEKQGGFDDYLWRFVDGHTIVNHWRSMEELPTKTPESDQMSKALKKDGFKFVGSTICYAFMQAAGLVNDHIVSCFRHRELIEQFEQK